jgi:hypothetical protein
VKNLKQLKKLRNSSSRLLMSKQKFSKKRPIGLLSKRLPRFLKLRIRRDKSSSKSQRHSKLSLL